MQRGVGGARNDWNVTRGVRESKTTKGGSASTQTITNDLTTISAGTDTAARKGLVHWFGRVGT